MTQTLTEKAQAIASVLWLLPEHYSMIRIGRSGVHFINEIEQPELAGWRPKIPEEFEGWPIEQIKRWYAYQHYLSKKYRLRSIERAMQRLDKEHPEQCLAVVMECVEDGLCTWYDPERVSDRCKAGLEFLADDVPGEVPWFQEAVVDFSRHATNKQARDKRIREMHADGISGRKIARELRCSHHTVKAVICGLAVRCGRTVSARS